MLIAPVLWLALSPATFSSREPIDIRKPAAADGTVVIKVAAGDLKVIGWDRAEIHVKGSLKNADTRLEFVVDGKRARIKVVVLGTRKLSGAQSDLEIRVPKNSRVKMATRSGDVDVTGVEGPLKIESASGDIKVQGTAAEVEAESASGDIKLQVEAAEVLALTVSGDIHLTGGCGRVSVESMSGDIDGRGGRFKRFRAKTVSGDVKLTADLEARGALTVNTHTGDVHLRWPQKTGAAFEIATVDGDLHNRLKTTNTHLEEDGSYKVHEFVIGSGDAWIEIETFNGDVHIAKAASNV